MCTLIFIYFNLAESEFCKKKSSVVVNDYTIAEFDVSLVQIACF